MRWGYSVSDQESTELLPRWDLTPFFPSLESGEFQQAFDHACRLIDEAVSTFDRLEISESSGGALEPAVAADSFDDVVAILTDLQEELETLFSYLYAVFTADTTNEAPQTRLSELEQRVVALAKLDPRLTAWLGAQDTEALLAASKAARDHEYLIQRARSKAQHLMSPAEESLAAELRVSSGSAWEKLRENVASQISVEIEIDGELIAMSMPELRLLALDPRRDVRELAYQIELKAWAANAVPIAAALNGIKGESLALTARRKWRTPLDLALFENAIDQESFEAMMSAARESFAEGRAYLKAKARLLGLDRLAWFDLYAPLESSSPEWTFSRCESTITDTFSAFSPRLGALARTAFNERWIDAPARPGKTDGAYCTNMQPGISRILMNFVPSYPGLATLAHELGHAYHNVALEARPALQRESPSTLAETASIFCETLVRHAALAEADERGELAILEGSLQDAIGVTIEVTSRFLFEQNVYEARADHDVPASVLCELMSNAQLQTYGDGLDPEKLHPFMWAAKGHYYSVDHAYYNFPYMFGLLFGLGLYRNFQDEPAGFSARYDELLSSTGRADASELAATFGLDLHSIDFWRSSLDVVRADINRFVELAEKYAPTP